MVLALSEKETFPSGTTVFHQGDEAETNSISWTRDESPSTPQSRMGSGRQSALSPREGYSAGPASYRPISSPLQRPPSKKLPVTRFEWSETQRALFPRARYRIRDDSKCGRADLVPPQERQAGAHRRGLHVGGWDAEDNDARSTTGQRSEPRRNSRARRVMQN